MPNCLKLYLRKSSQKISCHIIMPCRKLHDGIRKYHPNDFIQTISCAIVCICIATFRNLHFMHGTVVRSCIWCYWIFIVKKKNMYNMSIIRSRVILENKTKDCTPACIDIIINLCFWWNIPETRPSAIKYSFFHFIIT